MLKFCFSDDPIIYMEKMRKKLIKREYSESEAHKHAISLYFKYEKYRGYVIAAINYMEYLVFLKLLKRITDPFTEPLLRSYYLELAEKVACTLIKENSKIKNLIKEYVEKHKLDAVIVNKFKEVILSVSLVLKEESKKLKATRHKLSGIRYVESTKMQLIRRGFSPHMAEYTAIIAFGTGSRKRAIIDFARLMMKTILKAKGKSYQRDYITLTNKIGKEVLLHRKFHIVPIIIQNFIEEGFDQEVVKEFAKLFDINSS